MRICAKCGGGFTGRRSRFCSLECSGDISRNFRHGQCNSREYQSWRKMRSRCLCPTFLDYPRYGGRGITICERWEVFENFLADMGPRPEGKTLDRKDNNGNYEPENCRWATMAEQNRNKSNNYTAEQDKIVRDGIANGLSFPQIAKLLGKSTTAVSSYAARNGLSSGKPIQKITDRPDFAWSDGRTSSLPSTEHSGAAE